MKETSPQSNNGTILDINESFKIEFDPISDALAAIRNGECIIVVDDERRENEGDLICAAQFATPQQINFMATEGRGLICLAMQGEKLDSLDLPLMVDRNTDEIKQLLRYQLMLALRIMLQLEFPPKTGQRQFKLQ